MADLAALRAKSAEDLLSSAAELNCVLSAANVQVMARARVGIVRQQARWPSAIWMC